MAGSLTSTSSDDLVARYREAASAHGRATESGDSASANEQADVVAEIHAELRRRDDRSILLPLLEDADPGVRGWAGAHLLETDPDRAARALDELSSVPGNLVAFSAKMTLEQWLKGELTFP